MVSAAGVPRGERLLPFLAGLCVQEKEGAMKSESHRVAEFRLMLRGKEAVGVFREASGLDSENEVQEVKQGRGRKLGNIVLRRGLVDGPLLEWIEAAENNGPEASGTDCMLELLDYDGSAIATFLITHARPSQVKLRDAQAKGTDVGMEELTLSYERLEMV
jgi:phage tail-like protein